MRPQASLKFLQNRLGMDLWMVTRTEGEDWIVLQIEDQSYGVKQVRSLIGPIRFAPE